LLLPYYLRQRGHIGGNDYYTGHTCNIPVNTDIGSENFGSLYTVLREAVVQPLQDVKSLPANTMELQPSRGTSAEMYDHQVDTNGSFRTRAGNSKKLVGGQTPAATSTMDLSIEYDAEQATYMIRLGPAGAEAATVTLKATTASDATVTVTCKDLTATLTGSATINAPKGVKITGDVTIDGKLSVSGDISTQQTVTCEDLTSETADFNEHTHIYTLPAVADGTAPTAPPT
jgi:hypothetical protein